VQYDFTVPNKNVLKITKKYYTIGEVAKLLNVSTSLLRFWEKKIPVLQPYKSKNGTRRYTQADIAQLQKIYGLVKKQGYTLQGARKAMQCARSKPVGNIEIVHNLQRLKKFLVYLKENVVRTK